MFMASYIWGAAKPAAHSRMSAADVSRKKKHQGGEGRWNQKTKNDPTALPQGCLRDKSRRKTIKTNTRMCRRCCIPPTSPATDTATKFDYRATKLDQRATKLDQRAAKFDLPNQAGTSHFPCRAAHSATEWAAQWL